MLLPNEVCHESLLFRVSLVVKKRQGEVGQWASVTGKETSTAIKEFL